MKIRLVLSIVMSLLVLYGCASSSKKAELQDARSSQALRIARAAGFKDIRDIDAETYKSLDPASGSVFKTAKAVGIASGLMKATQGLPALLEGGLLFLDALPKARPEESPRLIAWMPKERAPSAQDAITVMRDTWVRAVAAALPEAKVELVERVYEAKPLLGPNSTRTRRYISIETPMCEACRMGSAVLQDGGRPKEVTAPAFLGARDAWFWGGLGKDHGWFSRYPWMDASLDRDERLDFLCRVSAGLPEWAYLYVPPDEKITRVPLILHRGEMLKFVEPEMNAPEE